MVDGRHEDEEPARHRDVRGQARALRAERLLDDLDQHLLALFQQVFDLGFRPVAVVARAGPGRIAVAAAAFHLYRRGRRDRLFDGGDGGRRAGFDVVGEPGYCGRERRRLWRLVLVVAGLEPVELLDGIDDFGDVEKRVPFETDVNEGGLHAREDLGDPPLVDVADDSARPLALDEDLDDLIVLEDGDPRIVVARGDDHLLVHG